MKTYITKIDGKYYAFAATEHQVYSIGADKPAKSTGGSCWVARWTDAGIKYVASASPSRAAAISKARRAGNYFGEV